MRKAESTRQFIIKHASSLFNKHGYAGTSLSRITEATGLTKGAVYGNFESKEHIALESLQFNFDLIYDELDREIRKYDNSCDRLTAFASYYETHYDKIAAMGGCPILNVATENDDGNPALRKKVLRLMRLWRASLRRIMEQGIRRGEIRKDADTARFTSLFIALVEGGIMHSMVTGKREHVSRAVGHIKDMINNDLRV